MMRLDKHRETCNNVLAEPTANQQACPAKGELVNNSVPAHIDIEQVESHMLSMPQADCPVAHHFGPGVYVRELTLPAGTLAIGHAQKFEHLNVVLTGKVAMVDGGSVKIIQAPAIFTGQPGRKIGYVLETCVWQNIYATEETDIDKLEAMFLDKSPAWEAANTTSQAQAHDAHQDDRDDFLAVIEANGFDEETVRRQSEDETDQIELPIEWSGVVTVRPSAIEGKGLFASWPISAGDMICPARIGGKRTQAGRYTNHAKDPNAIFVMDDYGDIHLVARRDIAGCKGGSQGEEITVNYQQALSLSGIQIEGTET